MSNSVKKKVNIVLSNGLYIVSAKFRKGTPIITLFATDFINSTRLVLDLEKKSLLANRDNIELNSKDIENILAALEIKAAA